MPVFKHSPAASRFLVLSTAYLFARRRAGDVPARVPSPRWLPLPPLSTARHASDRRA
jgi:hypothetical protein